MRTNRLMIALFGVLAVTLIVATVPATKTDEVEPVNQEEIILDLPSKLLELGFDEEVTIIEDPSLLEFEAAPASKGKKPRCKDCSITIGDSCERVSCNPCCYSCAGLPYLVCTS